VPFGGIDHHVRTRVRRSGCGQLRAWQSTVGTTKVPVYVEPSDEVEPSPICAPVGPPKPGSVSGSRHADRVSGATAPVQP